MSTPYYKYHLFFCTNRRDEGMCCAQFGSADLREYAKRQVKARGLSGAGGVRVNTAGCLDRCELGPVLVVYPEGVWYSYVDEHDIDEIIDQHLVNGVPVERLRIDSNEGLDTLP